MARERDLSVRTMRPRIQGRHANHGGRAPRALLRMCGRAACPRSGIWQETMRTLRVRRTERRPSSPVLRVTDRDVAVLHGVGRLKFAMTGQLAKPAFHATRSAAHKRIPRLFDARLIRALSPPLYRDN